MPNKKGILSRCTWITNCVKSRFASTYYVLNTLLFISYILTRQHFRDSAVFTKREMYSFYLTREEQIFGLLGITFFIKIRFLVTLDMILGHFFGSFQVGLIVITLGVDYTWFGMVILFATLMYVLVPQPSYTGPAKVRTLSEDDFSSLVEHSSPDESWIVLFYAHWAYDCNQFMVLFSQLSLHFGSKHLKFGKINAAHAAHVSMKYNISLKVTTKQLPTLILFQHGKEVARTPEINREGKVTKMILSGENIINLFDVNTISQRPPKKPNSKKA